MSPIRPENRGRYPEDWKAIRERILLEAGGRCEFCGVRNHAVGARDRDGRWHDCEDIESMNSSFGAAVFGEFPRMVKIVLTIAHLDHVPEHNERDNLRALCQRCHNRHDARHRADGVKARAEERVGQMTLGGIA